MEKINIEKLGQIYNGIPPLGTKTFDAQLADKELAEKVNEVIEYINKNILPPVN